MFQWLTNFDKDFFLFLNGLHTPFLDHIMWWISKTAAWIPLYVFLLFVIIFKTNLKPHQIIVTLLFLAFTVLLADQLSVWIKNLVERPRPTHHPEIMNMVHTVRNYRGGEFGFVSSHAANVFGVSAFLVCLFKNRVWKWLYVWALVVSYSRIYLGVHYPLDIFCGGLLGALIGISCYTLSVKTITMMDRRIIRKPEKETGQKAQTHKS